MSLETKLNELVFKEEILEKGEIYAVGGAVRDELLGIESKDLDLLIRGIPSKELVEILKKYGKVDEVGESFGVIKFKALGGDEIDIALPRTEEKTGEKHTDFKVVSDPFLPIEEDLQRRDFTMNAIAMAIDGTLIDPFDGVGDIKSKTIRAVRPQAFKEDPLRILRAIQFASRFNFNIEKKTLLDIQHNAAKMRTVSPERIVIELEKIITKGNIGFAVTLLSTTGIYSTIFPACCTLPYIIKTKGYDHRYVIPTNISNLAELLYYLSGTSNFDLGKEFKRILKVDNDTAKLIEGLVRISNAAYYGSAIARRVFMFEAFDRCPALAESKIFSVNDSSVSDAVLHKDFRCFVDGTFPKSLKEIDCTGHDLIGIGIQEGPKIAEVYKKIVRQILSSKVENNKRDILKFVKREYAL